MSFELKVQTIQPNISEVKGSTSIAHDFPKPNESILSKRGRLFIVVSVIDAQDFDLSSLFKIFSEHIHEEYYKNTDSSPLKSLEFAVKSGIDFLSSLKSADDKKFLIDKNHIPNISLSAAIVWNSILYTANIGPVANYVVRGSGTRDLNDEDIQNTWDIYSNSIILESEDVIIIGTSKFASEYKAKNILENLSGLSTKLLTDPNAIEIAALLIKIIQPPVINNKRDRSMAKPLITSVFSAFSNLKNKLSPEGSLSEEFKPFQNKKSAPISSITGLTDSQEIKKPTSRPRRIRKVNNNNKLKSGIGILVIIMAVVLGITFYNKTLANRLSRDPNDQAISVIPRNDAETSEELDNVAKDVPAIYIFNEKKNYANLEISSFAIYEKENLVIYSRADKGIYYFDKKNNSLKKIIDEVDSLEQLKCYVRFCIFQGNNIVSLVNPSTPEKVDKYPVESKYRIFDIDYFSDRIYLLTSDNIVSFKIGESNPQITEWLKTSEKIQNPKSMTIDSNVYVIDQLVVSKYLNGVKQVFNLTPEAGKNPSKIFADTKYIYVFDQVDTTLRMFSKNGASYKNIPLDNFSFSDEINIQSIQAIQETSVNQPNFFVQSDNMIYYLSTITL
ncbi:MAG: hypothetical protein QG570_675 [Patescibacteria group bacterium]|nr:hypothetical protein [Patescibacteria group bacterium]